MGSPPDSTKLNSTTQLNSTDQLNSINSISSSFTSGNFSSKPSMNSTMVSVSETVGQPTQTESSSINQSDLSLPNSQTVRSYQAKLEPSNNSGHIGLSTDMVLDTPFLFKIGTSSRPYIDIEIGGTELYSLLDTGSSRTYLGSTGLEAVRSIGCKIDYNKSGVALMANDTMETIIGEAHLPITFSGTTHIMDVKIIPGLADTCVLDMDFGEIFGIVMHLRDRQLWLADEPIIKFAFDRKDVDTSNFCNGIALLQDTEKEQLEQFLKRIIPPQPEKLPPAKLVEHVIDDDSFFHWTGSQRLGCPHKRL